MNVIDPMAERRRTDSTDVDDTEDPESCHKRHLSTQKSAGCETLVPHCSFMHGCSDAGESEEI